MVSTKILPDPVLNVVKKNLFLYSTLKKLTLYSRSFLPPLSCPHLPGRIHPNDFMLKKYTSDAMEDYREQSKALFQLILDALNQLAKPLTPNSQFIDFGSGYGRITRWLTNVLPTRHITACDVLPEAINFCRKEFNVKTILTNGEFANCAFEHYDIIFSCSLLTHLSLARTISFFKLLNKISNPGAIAIFSIHGNYSLERLENINTYLDKKAILNALDKDGIYFHSYPHYKDKELGDTFFTFEYLQSLLATYCPHFKIVKKIEAPCYQWGQDWIICQTTPELL